MAYIFFSLYILLYTVGLYVYRIIVYTEWLTNPLTHARESLLHTYNRKQCIKLFVYIVGNYSMQYANMQRRIILFYIKYIFNK